jgi:hypothetical protein
MKHLSIAIVSLTCATVVAATQNSNSNPSASSGQNAQPAVDASKPSTDSPVTPSKKPKKVWTNDEISSAGGPNAISVVGNSKPQAGRAGQKPTGTNSSAGEGQIANYRNRLHQLNGQLEATDKQISELRNFNGNNSSASGGINMSHRYTTTSVDDQVKALEEKKKQLQAQIDAVEDQARKNGVEPGQLR